MSARLEGRTSVNACLYILRCADHSYVGMTTGDLVVARAAMKPLATLNRPVLQTVDVETKEATVSFKERTDVTAVPAAGVVGETMMALVLASEALRKFGGDSVAEFVRNHDGYRASLA